MIYTRLLPLILCLTAPFGVVADTRAVLVGVSDYLYLDADLKGPVNDVGLLADALLKRGLKPQDITILAEDAARVPANVVRGYPDRTAILAALDAAIATAGQGDTVMFYFSGHGAQMPDVNGDEGGGLDEIFLPRDAKGWNGGMGTVENAIIDDEFALRARAAAERGVQLVAIIDACHSGTGFRALDQGAGHARYITPLELGIPTQDDPAGGETPPPPGEYVFLYAAQADERAFEYPIGADGAWHGDFTRSLVAVMTEVADLSYAQWVAAATARMKARTGQLAQTPDIEGPLADTAVPGADAPGLTRIAVEGQTLQSGALHDITLGSTVTLYASLLDPTPRGTATISDVRTLAADLTFDAPLPDRPITHAAITERAVTAQAAIAVSPEAAARIGGQDALAERLDITLAAPGTFGAAQVVLAGEQLALVGGDGVLDAAGPGSSQRLSDDLTVLAQELTAIAGRLRLEQALAQISGAKSGGFALLKTDIETTFATAPGVARGTRCRPGKEAPASATSPAHLVHCDVLSVALTNPTAKIQDITVLLIDAKSEVSVLWPQRNQSNRLEPGGSKALRFALTHAGDPATTLRESVLVLSLPAKKGAARTVFDTLATSSTARGTGTPMAAWLGQLTDPAQSSRGFTLAPKGPKLALSRLDYTLTRPSRP